MDSKEWGITNVLSFEPSDGITLKYIFGLRRSSYDRFTNQTTLDLPIQIGHNWQDYGRTISHEVQALGNVLEGRLAWAVGFFHSKEVSDGGLRSEEHTSELQSLMRISYAVFCLKKKIIH